MAVVSEFKIDPTSTRRTIAASLLQTAQFFKVPMLYQANSMLNEKYDFSKTIRPPAGQYPYANYFQFGRNGFYCQPGGDGVPEIRSYVHEPVDGGLFEGMPFVLRDLNNDLTATQREMYAGRAILRVGSTDKIAYWLCKLNKTDSSVLPFIVTPDATEDIRDPFIPNSSTLSPTPTKPTIDAINVVTGKYGVVECKIKMILTQWMIDELLNVKQLLTGNSVLDVTEIAIVHGYPQNVTSNISGTSVTYEEAIVAQISAFFPNKIAINNYAGDTLEMSFHAGIDDPLSLALMGT
jgi:hypothetical protein